MLLVVFQDAIFSGTFWNSVSLWYLRPFAGLWVWALSNQHCYQRSTALCIFFTDTQTHETPAASGIKLSLSVESGVGPSKVDAFSENLETWSRSELRVANHFLFYIFFVGKEVSIGSADQPSYWTFHKNLQRWSLPDVASLHDDLGTAQRVPWLPSVSKFLSVLDFGVTSGCQIPSMLQYEWPCRAARNRLEKGLWGGMRVIKGYFGDRVQLLT